MAIKEIIATGKDVAEAKENARAALGVGELDEVQFEVLHLGSRGIFGLIGVKPAQVKAFIEIPDAPKRDRHERRREKPNPLHVDNETSEACEATEATETTESAEAPKAQSKNRNRKRNNRKPREAAPTAEGEQKPRSRVIPEAELKLEKREVAEGEDLSFDFIKTVISDIGLDAEANLYSCDDGTRRITITGNDASALIGHHGDTLDALQYLANLASAKKNVNGERDKSRVTLDIEGYRAKREDTLRALARRMAAKALRNKRSVMLEPMSAYERRIIHSEIQGIEGVSTNSIGSDNNRKIVIYLTDKKPEGIFEEPKATPLSEEFRADEDDLTASIGAIDQACPSDLDSEESLSETVTVETTHPADEDSYASQDEDDDDIK